MSFQILELNRSGCFLKKHRGFLRIQQPNQPFVDLPIDDVHAVLAVHPQTICTQAVFLALAERGIPYIVCNRRYQPAAVLWPVDSHHHQSLRFRLQLQTQRPVHKRVWKSIVRAKIRHQADVLQRFGEEPGFLRALIPQVRSGDPKNLEAQAARYYWPKLFGRAFRRNVEEPTINALLNYGYAVLRSTVARAIMGAGLHPTLGVHHCGPSNPMALADDLMEPFRPTIDHRVRMLVDDGQRELTSDIKAELAKLITLDLPSDQGQSPLCQCVQRMVFSLVRIFEGQSKTLTLPSSALATHVSTLLHTEEKTAR